MSPTNSYVYCQLNQHYKSIGICLFRCASRCESGLDNLKQLGKEIHDLTADHKSAGTPAPRKAHTDRKRQEKTKHKSKPKKGTS